MQLTCSVVINHLAAKAKDLAAKAEATVFKTKATVCERMKFIDHVNVNVMQQVIL